MPKKSDDAKKTAAKKPKATKAASLDDLRARIEPGWALSPAAKDIPANDAPARSGRPFEIEDLFAYALPGEAVVSPDGTVAITSVTTIDKEANEYRSAL